MQIVERRIVSCPQCGFTIKIDPSRKFVCKCGYSTDSMSFNGVEEWVIDRHQICEKCPEFNNDRCNKIELGCRPAFFKYIRNSQSECPLIKWTKIQ
jgi:hypothetical protein